MKSITRKFAALMASVLLACQMLACPLTAFAADTAGSNTASSTASSVVTVSSEGNAALIEGAAFALDEFSRSQKGSNAAIVGEDDSETYYGYRYYVSATPGSMVAIGMTGYAVVYVPSDQLKAFGLDLKNDADVQQLKDTLLALDAHNAVGGTQLTADEKWYFTSQPTYTVNKITFSFDQQLKKGQYFATIIGEDGSDITDNSNPLFDKPSFGDSCRLADPSSVNIAVAKTGLDAVAEFLTTLDWSPLWVSLKVTGIAIVFIFVLGLAAAYFTLNISQKAQNIFDSIFTIPMVLPPTVCGFVLLYLCGSKTPFGQFFIDVGFPLIFSQPAAIIAATVVAFPLMYRNSRGAFENLDANMLDCARTLGWSNLKIFFRLMLPLSWSSIAAATVLAFARALGEFGATLFLAGNYLGVTRTIPIAIYFEWMNGNDSVAWFWTGVIIVISFIVIMFINLWSKRTTRYRKRIKE